MAAGVAVQAEETSREDSTIDVGAELAFDESRDRRALLAGVGEEGLEVLSHDFVEQCLLGLVTLVFDGSAFGGCSATIRTPHPIASAKR